MKGSLLFLMTLYVLSSQAQSAGDYRSKATGNWSNPATWERFDGTSWQAAVSAPSNTDGIIEIRNSYTVTINSVVTADQVLIDAGGILSVMVTLTLVDGAGNDLTCNGTLNINANVSGAGSSIIPGIMNWTGGTLGSPFTLPASSVLNITGTASKFLSDVMSNAGTINWNNGTFFLSGGTLNNSGTFNNSFDGTLTYSGSNNLFTNSGTFSKTGGTVTTTLTAPFTNSGTVNVNSGGTILTNNTFTNSGTINIPATGTFTNSSTLTFSTGTVLSGSGTLVLSGNEAINLALNIPATMTLSKTANSTSGAGTTTVNGIMNWTGGTLGSPFTLPASSVLNITGTASKFLSDVMSNAGTINWNNGTFFLSGGTLNNSGTFNNSFDGTLTYSGSNNLFTNSGTFSKTGGTVTTTLTAPFTNSGTVNVNSGGTILTNNTFTNSGTISIPATGTFTNSSTLTFSTGTVLSGSGTLVLSGNEAINLALNIPAAMTLSKTANSTSGSGTTTVNGIMNWTGGTLGSPFTLPASSVLNITGTASKFLSDVMSNAGTINWNNGTFFLSGGTLNNSGTFNNSFDGTLTYSGSNNLFTNSGTFSKTGGTVTTTLTAPFTNSGTVNVNSGGTILTNNTFTNSGTINIPATGTFTNSSTLTFSTGTVLSGSGTLVLSGNEAINLALNIPAAMTLSKTANSTSGAGTTTVNGIMNWTGGTLGSPFTLPASSVLNITGTASKFLSDVMSNAGTINWNNGTFFLSGGTLNNSGTFNNSFDGTLTYSGSNNLFTNSGTFSKTGGTVTTTLTAPFTNSGTVNVNSGGTILTNNTFTNSGTISIPATGTFTNSSTLTFSTGTVLSGSGTLVLSGNEAINLALNIPAAMTLSKTANSTSGSGTTTVNGIMNWTGGTLGSPFTLPASSVLNITGTASKFLSDVMSNAGTINWNNGTFFLSGGTLNNSGTFNNSFDGTFSNTSSNNSFTNSGTFSKTGGTGTSSINVVTINTGSIKGNGTISFGSTFANNGKIEPGVLIGTLTLTSSSPVFTANSTLNIEIQDNTGAGTGNDLLKVGSALLTGSLTITEIGLVPQGRDTIISSTGTLTGTFSTVNKPVMDSIIYTANLVIVVRRAQGPLPVKLLSFTASPKGSAIELKWQTATEYNSDKFAIERSGDGISFTQIGAIRSVGDSLHKTVYSFVDDQPLQGAGYYRLKMVDKDDRFEYSGVVKAEKNLSDVNTTVYPNPVSTSLIVDGLRGGQQHTIQLLDMAGRIVLEAQTKNSILTLNIGKQSQGVYWLRIITDGKVVTSRKIIKQ